CLAAIAMWLPEPFGLPLGVSVFDHDVAALDVTEVTQSLTEGLLYVGGSGQVGRQVADSSDLGRLLGLGGERRGKQGSQASDEGAAVHQASRPSTMRRASRSSSVNCSRSSSSAVFFKLSPHI